MEQKRTINVTVMHKYCANHADFMQWCNMILLMVQNDFVLQSWFSAHGNPAVLFETEKREDNSIWAWTRV